MKYEKINSRPLISNYHFKDIKSMIFTFRGKQVMLDRDIANYFGIETKRLNEQVKKNMERFPESFCFKLTRNEKNELVAKCDQFENLKHSSALPFAFTEQGVAMLTAVIKNSQAVSASIYIMNAFVDMRKFMIKNSAILDHLGKLELVQINTDNIILNKELKKKE
ncbi:MAG: ORF6N domain-containing protein [Candidatus Neomarinimicrobiota bacterium]